MNCRRLFTLIPYITMQGDAREMTLLPFDPTSPLEYRKTHSILVRSRAIELLNSAKARLIASTTRA